jgi:hypothetical protein
LSSPSNFSSNALMAGDVSIGFRVRPAGLGMSTLQAE